MNTNLAMGINTIANAAVQRVVLAVAIRWIVLGIIIGIAAVFVVRFIGRRVIEFRNFRAFKRSRRIAKN